MRYEVLQFVALLLVITSFSPLIAGGEAEVSEPTRMPDKYGSITGDETWFGDVAVDDVIIEKGVTVRIINGTLIRMYSDAQIWVRGNLIVEGEMPENKNVVFVLDFGSSWRGIVVNETGSATIRNTTMYDATTHITLKGDNVVLDHVIFNSGYTGVNVQGGSGHDMLYIGGKYTDVVLRLQGCDRPSKIMYIVGVGASSVLHMADSHNQTVEIVIAYDCYTGIRLDGGCGGDCGNITIRYVRINQTAPHISNSYGFQI